jgi:hypothetical protein
VIEEGERHDEYGGIEDIAILVGLRVETKFLVAAQSTFRC